MTENLVRRSILVVSVNDHASVAASWRHNADAIALELDDGFAAGAEGRERARDAISVAARGGAEVFVRIDPDLALADITAAAWPGLTGVLLPGADTPERIRDVARILEELEAQRGLPTGSLQIFLQLGTAKAVWDIRSLLTASPRISSVSLDYTRLCANLAIVPRDDFDPFLFAAGRLVIESTAARVLAVGISHPLGVSPRRLPADEIARLAERGRNSGFKGAFCPDPSWVEPCNLAFTPTTEQIEYYRTIRRLFAEGLAQGRAAVPIEGRMIDVPVDERARIQIALWERCQARDAAKAAALAANAKASIP
jgi:citrate lyase subunit beta / citryl-CoA lyase